MRKRLTFLLITGFAIIGFGQEKWKKEGIRLPYPICYASDEMHQTQVGLPPEYFLRLKSAPARMANIEVTYEGFSPEAQQAFQYAVDIWKNLIYSPVPIRVKASWISLGKGVLGSCGPSAFYKNFDATQKWDTYYPVALVEKMTGEQANSPGDYELVAEFNKDFANWYLGTDANTPERQYDFVSVVLHELAHGLGFTGLLNSQEGKGLYGYGSDPLPSVFDQHIINKNRDYLVNKTLFPNPSVTLNLGLTSGWLEFYTQLTENRLPRLYAPVTYDEGSSLYHLDDATYPAGNANSLMTPFTGMGEQIHHPGPDALAIMYEMGWKSISMRHNPLKDIETALTPVDFTVTVDSDNELDLSKLYLVYSTNRFLKTDSVLLKSTGTPGSFSVSLSQFKSGEVDYFFSATDVFGRRFVYPSNSPARYLSFRIGPDRQLPVVKHDPVKYMLSSHTSARVEAKVTDNLGVKSVSLEYYVNGGTLQKIAMQPVSEDLYSADFTLPAGSVSGGEKISYRIVATDASLLANVGRLPSSGYNTFMVETIKAPSEKYNNNFNNTFNDFIGTDFFLSTPTGFASRGLNSAHPYPSPDADNMEFNHTAILRNPILLKTGGIMSFDEIVLVEPADSGVAFGDEEFWDYVIVEGSKDGGQTWLPLLDGYDSNANISWLNLYNSSVSGNNSTAVPTKDHFVRRELLLTGNGKFAPGDVILIRFRLFSDPYAHGWGWIIDNLSIQEVITSAESKLLSPGEVRVYPNPVSDQLTVSVESKNMPGKLTLKIYNGSGTLVFNQQYEAGAKDFHKAVDVENLAPGLYLLSVETENGQKITRKILVQ